MYSNKFNKNNPYELTKKERLKIHKKVIKKLNIKPRYRYSKFSNLNLILLVVIIYVFLILIGKGIIK